MSEEVKEKESSLEANNNEERASKRIKIDTDENNENKKGNEREKGIAHIKSEYIVPKDSTKNGNDNHDSMRSFDDDAEAGNLIFSDSTGNNIDGRNDKNKSKNKKNKNKNKGQNKNRKFDVVKDSVQLCSSVLNTNEDNKCQFGDKCKYEHDINKYLDSKPVDINGICPVFAENGICPYGVKCRWYNSHKDKKIENNLNKDINNENKYNILGEKNYEVNRIGVEIQNKLQKKIVPLPKSEIYIKYLSTIRGESGNEEIDELNNQISIEARKENESLYKESILKPLEKSKLDYNNKKILSPLTTVGNLPFRRLCKKLGADVTFSEMAMSLPLLQGSKSEWALTRAHYNEIPNFGIQIAASKPWQAIKATEALTSIFNNNTINNVNQTISEINLNCGCPIDLVYKAGAGSALMDAGSKLCKMLNGMNYVSDNVPITVKLRMGTKDGHPNAINLVKRLIYDTNVQAITLHGRSRAQRYTKSADWDYIKKVGEIIKQANIEKEENKEKEDDTNINTNNKVWFIGNGDVYNYRDYWNGIEKYKCDSVMIARGALIKPWIFEEIDLKQDLDKSASERLEYIKEFANFGLDHWGSDIRGVNTTRRFLCEWLSFTHRYIPLGILEHVPNHIQDRAPIWKGRNDLETLLGSSDYRDWVKISEMFLGPAHESFNFIPKHKSNAYESTDN